MKKLILLTAMVAGLFITQPNVMAQGQLNVINMSGGDTNMVNTTASYSSLALPFTNGFDVITIVPLITKRSGTVAGTVELQGSIDGTNYFRIKGHGQVSTVDTLVLTNVSTVQNFVWIFTPSLYKYYRVKYTGVGTMNASVAAKLEYIYSNQ